MKCTCYITCDDEIDQCRLCKAAPLMYEALKAIASEPNLALPGKLSVIISTALSEAEEK